MFVTVTVLTIPLGWLAWEANVARTRLAMYREIELSGGEITDTSLVSFAIIKMPA
jgi:hypothetical protein